MSFFGRLNSQPWVHVLVRTLRLRVLAELFLKVVPLKRRLPGDLTCRLRHLESFFLADEIFTRDFYGEPARSGVKSFADIGCNMGFFALLMARETGNRAIPGLLVDANPAMIGEARAMARENALTALRFAEGIAGADTPDFYIHPSNLGSSRFPMDEPGRVSKGGWKKIESPLVDVGARWQAEFGDLPCDLLKIDVEGSELDFFKKESAFLARTAQIVVEWHTWIAGLDRVEETLHEHGFVLKKVLQEEPTTGVAWFIKPRNPS